MDNENRKSSKRRKLVIVDDVDDEKSTTPFPLGCVAEIVGLGRFLTGVEIARLAGSCKAANAAAVCALLDLVQMQPNVGTVSLTLRHAGQIVIDALTWKCNPNLSFKIQGISTPDDEQTVGLSLSDKGHNLCWINCSDPTAAKKAVVNLQSCPGIADMVCQGTQNCVSVEKNVHSLFTDDAAPVLASVKCVRTVHLLGDESTFGQEEKSDTLEAVFVYCSTQLASVLEAVSQDRLPNVACLYLVVADTNELSEFMDITYLFGRHKLPGIRNVVARFPKIWDLRLYRDEGVVSAYMTFGKFVNMFIRMLEKETDEEPGGEMNGFSVSCQYLN